MEITGITLRIYFEPVYYRHINNVFNLYISKTFHFSHLTIFHDLCTIKRHFRNYFIKSF